jgi:hypothetical protein
MLEVIGKEYTMMKTITGMASKVEEETLLAIGDRFRYPPDKGTYLTGDTMQAAFALTLCINRTRERHPYHNFVSTPEWVSMLLKLLSLTATSQNDKVRSARETPNTI